MKKAEEAIPTALYNTEADQEMQAEYGAPKPDYKPVFLYVERGPGQGQLLEVKQGTTVIGRASVSDLRLQHPSISRRHAQVRRVGEQFFVKDLGSQNGTFVNKERIAGEVEAKPGDNLALGNALVILRGPLVRDENKAPPLFGVPKERISTAVVARPSGPFGQVVRSPNAMKIAAAAGVLGFAMAGLLAFVMIKAMSSGQPAAAPVQPVAAVAAPAPVAIAPAPPPEQRAKVIDEAIARKMAEQRAPEVDEAPVLVKDGRAATPVRLPTSPYAGARPVAPAPVARPAAVVSRPAPVAVAPAQPRDEEDDAPAAKGGASRASLLAAYEKGNAEGSLEAAKKAGDKELVAKLSSFIQAYDAANDAMMANNGTGAIVNFQKALAYDDQLSSGWGKYGTEIRRKLANLYVLVGIQHTSNGDGESARKAFEAALKHDPSNERAKAQLDKLNGGAGRRESADDAFDEGSNASAPRKAVAPKKAPSKGNSIDDAFGD